VGGAVFDHDDQNVGEDIARVVEVNATCREFGRSRKGERDLSDG
jgi:hypothetical protein